MDHAYHVKNIVTDLISGKLSINNGIPKGTTDLSNYLTHFRLFYVPNFFEMLVWLDDVGFCQISSFV